MPTKKESVATGAARFQRFEYILEHGFAWKRFAFDRLLHQMMLRAAAELIYGDDWEAHGPDLIKQRGWAFMSKLVCGKAPRRFGKSVALAKYLVGMIEVLLTMPGIIPRGGTFTISVFSTGMRASSGIRKYVTKFLTERGLADNQTVSNQHNIELAQDPQDDGSPNILINFLPSRATACVIVFCVCFFGFSVSVLFFYVSFGSQCRYSFLCACSCAWRS